jgi:hypothetical protein
MKVISSYPYYRELQRQRCKNLQQPQVGLFVFEKKIILARKTLNLLQRLRRGCKFRSRRISYRINCYLWNIFNLQILQTACGEIYETRISRLCRKNRCSQMYAAAHWSFDLLTYQIILFGLYYHAMHGGGAAPCTGGPFPENNRTWTTLM